MKISFIDYFHEYPFIFVMCVLILVFTVYHGKGVFKNSPEPLNVVRNEDKIMFILLFCKDVKK